MKFNSLKRTYLINSLSISLLLMSLGYSSGSLAKSLADRVMDSVGDSIGAIVSGITNRFGYLANETFQNFSKIFNASQAKSTDKITDAWGSAIDTMNKVLTDIANKEFEMESQPAPYARPSTGVATSNLLVAMTSLEKEIEEVCTSTAKTLLQLDKSVQVRNVKAYKQSIVKRFNEAEIVKDLDVISLLSPEGYVGDDAIENSTYFIHFQMGDLYSLIDAETLESGSPIIARFTTILQAFKRIQGVRVRSSEMYEKFLTAYPGDVLHSNEETILKDTLKGSSYGLSINDCIDFEIYRRWKNNDWHEKLNQSVSSTALTQEFVEQQAYANFILFCMLKMEEQINHLEGLITIEKLDVNRRSKAQRYKNSVSL